MPSVNKIRSHIIQIKSKAVKLINTSPYLWWLSWNIIPHLWFLLPHEKTYYGFKHVAKNPKGLFLDVGANNGLSALGFRKLVPNYAIISIEANIHHEPALKKLEKKLVNYKYIITAAGSAAGSLTLYTPLYKGMLLHTGASLNLDYLNTSIYNAYPKSIASEIRIEKQKVNIIPLDNLQISPDIIKLDVEGFEIDVLGGLHTTIQKCRPVILVEYTSAIDAPLNKFCLDYNYSIYNYDARRDTFKNLQLRMNELIGQSPPINLFLIPCDKTFNLPI
jgi:FkbM family methyltransferase